MDNVIMSDIKINLEKKITKLADGTLLLGSRKLKKVRVDSKEQLPYQCYYGVCFAIKGATIVEFYSYCDIGGKFHGTANFMALDYDDIARMNNARQFSLGETERTQSLDAFINFIFTFVKMGFSIYLIDY